MFKNINANQFQDLIKYSNPIILDVRTPFEYNEGHINNALLIPHNELLYRMRELEPYQQRDILVYCHAGHRSVAGAQLLLSQGFSSVYNLQQGIIEWAAAGKELEK